MKLAHFFLGVDMRCGHEGLKALIKKKKIKIVEGEFIVFLNGKRTMLKMFCGDQFVMMHYKKDGRIIDPGIIPYLPKYCGGKQMDIDGALKEHLEDVLRRRKK